MIDKYLKLLKDYSLITIGCIIVAFSMNYFYLGNNLAQGGLSGICLTIYYLTKIENNIWNNYFNYIFKIIFGTERPWR